MTVDRVFAVISTADLDGAREWYSRLLGREPDLTPMDEVHEWHMGQGGMQLVDDSARAGRSMLTLIVGNLERTRTELTSRNLKLGPTSGGDFASIAQIVDPDGNRITFSEPGPASRQ